MKYIINILLLSFCGIAFAYYMSVCCVIPSNTLHWHLAQWLPLFGGATCCLVAGYDVGYNRYLHSPFWALGRFASALAAAGVGYVMGRELFF